MIAATGDYCYRRHEGAATLATGASELKPRRERKTNLEREREKSLLRLYTYLPLRYYCDDRANDRWSVLLSGLAATRRMAHASVSFLARGNFVNRAAAAARDDVARQQTADGRREPLSFNRQWSRSDRDRATPTRGREVIVKEERTRVCEFDRLLKQITCAFYRRYHFFPHTTPSRALPAPRANLGHRPVSAAKASHQLVKENSYQRLAATILMCLKIISRRCSGGVPHRNN